ncbi:hypothetical protein A5834_001329, partial [Enterococcus faecium]
FTNKLANNISNYINNYMYFPSKMMCTPKVRLEI